MKKAEKLRKRASVRAVRKADIALRRMWDTREIADDIAGVDADKGWWKLSRIQKRVRFQ
jgi:hypothetical protein